jgi:integrase/recombinase XerC
MSRYQLNKSKYLLNAEEEELRRVLKMFEDREPRDTALIELALSTGARASEILSIKATDLESEHQTVFIKGIKGSNDREIPVKSKLFSRLKSISENTTNEGLLFNISYPRLVQIWLSYRPCNKKFHSLRHTFALNLYKKTKDIRLVQVALGHRSIQNTMIYADYVYTTNELRKLIL